jgi:ParB family transcriptional regulator, chromosome partitioning protein
MYQKPEYKLIALSSLNKAPYNVRDPEGNTIEDMERSVKIHGILEPLLVNEVSHENFEIMAGARRAEAARRVGLQEVPCVVMKLLSEPEAQLISIVENIQRLNLSAMERAKVIEKVVERFGGNRSKAAEALGLSSAKVISEWLSPLLIDPEALSILRPIAGPTMNRRTALLSTVPRNKQKIVAELLNEKARDETQTRKIVKAVLEHPTDDPRAVVERVLNEPKEISVQVFLSEKANAALEKVCQDTRKSKSSQIKEYVEERLAKDGYLEKQENNGV